LVILKVVLDVINKNKIVKIKKYIINGTVFYPILNIKTKPQYKSLSVITFLFFI